MSAAINSDAESGNQFAAEPPADGRERQSTE
jgi:hypothetical protein